MRVLFLGKRHYTNQDVLMHRFGRIYWLPRLWHDAGITVHLLLLDYHGHHRAVSTTDGLTVQSLPALDPRSVKCLTAAAKLLRPDIVLASGDCFVGLLSYRLARRHGAKFVFDVYDDYSTFAAYRAFMGWNAMAFLCRRADLVVYASRAMADRHTFASASIVIPNGIDSERFVPVPASEARERIGLAPAGPLVGYFGSMKVEHGVGVLIRAVGILRTRRPDLQLLLCGKPDPATPLTGDGIIFHGLVPHARIPDYLNACDVLALPYLRGAFMDNASSCKIAEYLACRRPIVATNTPNFVQNFPEQARQLDAVLVPPADAGALARSIDRQLNDPVVAQPPDDMAWDRLATTLLTRLQGLFH